jgi:hypothetical protein
MPRKELPSSPKLQLGDPGYVGRGHPPKEHQYKKGKSGNPNGRPKGRHRFQKLMEKALRQAPVFKDGRSITREQLVMNVIDMNLAKGELRAVPLYLEVAREFGERADREYLEMDEARQARLNEALRRKALSLPREDEQSVDQVPTGKASSDDDSDQGDGR